MVPRSLIFLISILYSSAFMHHQQKISRTSTKLSKYPVTKKLKSSNDFEGYAIDQSGGSSSYERKPSLSANSTSSNSYPSRQDTCIMLFSGVIGTQPKETYLKQGNYVIRFSVSLSIVFIHHPP